MKSIMGITTTDWLKLLIENKFKIDPPYWHKAFLLTVRSLFNSFYRQKENRKYGSALNQIQADHSPLIILGHWRSGTTLLHNLMSLDQNFCFPNLFQVYNPHTFLYLEPMISSKRANEPAEKRPMDNMTVRFDSPAEDEFALAILSLRSPILSWSFPRQEQYYDRYLTFQNLPLHEIEKWKASLLLLHRKLTLKYQRRVIFKSPAHTGRIKLLLELFPGALFIHIHRNPFTAFLSMRKLYDTAISDSYLQQPNLEQINDGILRRYKLMYDAFFEQVNLIPKANYVEICFEDFEQDLIATIAHIYNSLRLTGFDNLKPLLQNYVASIAGYKKNVHPEIDSALREQVFSRWKNCFDAWNYKI